VRIADVVDVHDRFEAVPRAAEQTGLVDLLVVGGDITTGGTPDDAARASRTGEADRARSCRGRARC